MREPISSVVPPPAAVAPPLAEPRCDRRLARPFTCEQEFESLCCQTDLTVSKTQTHVTCGALIYPRRCVKCLCGFEQASCLLSVIYLFT